jgi:hypothetical protein
MLICLRIVPGMLWPVRCLPPAVLLPAMLVLSGCALLGGPADGPPPPLATEPPPSAVAAPAAPVETALRPAPVPVRKPPAPAVATPPPVTVLPDQRPPVVTGLDRAGLIRTYGLPVAEREAPPARIMEFGIGDCRLAAYLYFDTARNDFYTLHYDVNGAPAPNADVDRCLTRIARDANQR